MISIEDLYSRFLQCGSRVTTDSRAIQGGEMFIALKGENFDGNAYAAKALEAGAATAVVDCGRAPIDDTRFIEVPDTFEALRDLARYHREHCGGRRVPIIGLTGTNGKTTTKELIRSVLGAKYNVCATQGNLNNDIGVPLSLLKIAPETQIAVIEMGASHPEDITSLTDVAHPDFGLITNVGRAHLLGFGSYEGVKNAKGRLYDFLEPLQGEIFLNKGDEVLCRMAAARPALKPLGYRLVKDMRELATAPEAGCEVRGAVLPSSPQEPYLRLEVYMNGEKRTIRTALVGAYNALNVLAALCIGRRFNVPLEDAARAIEAYVPANARSQMMQAGTLTLILDAYNANPSSMDVALSNLEAMQAAGKVALLGDMRELGEDSLCEHSAVLARLQGTAGLRFFLCGEEFRKAIEAQGADASACGFWFSSSSSLAEALESGEVRIAADSVVLVKGSRGIMMEKVIPALDSKK